MISNLATSINAFAADLYRALAATPGNLFFSPASIALAFAMLHAGARGPTADELTRVFHFRKDARKDLEKLLADWSTPPTADQLAVANRLYADRTATIKDPFLELLRTVFAAPLEPLDFRGAPEPARQHINAWVAERTRDKIRDLLPRGAVDPATALVLVNAVHFKAKWQDPFKLEHTRPAPFHGAAGEREVPMMTRTGTGLNVLDGLKVLDLPYRGGTMAMTVVLPDARDGLPDLESWLSDKWLRHWFERPGSNPVQIHLPRFKIEPQASLKLKAPLQSLGLVRPFAAPDFSDISDEPLLIDDAYHQAFVAVDEEGTEAAAATAIPMTRGGPPPPPIPFVADHPFLFFIRDVKSGTILFLGRLTDPT